MKKMTIIFAAALALALTACGKSAETDSSGSGAPTSMTEQGQQSLTSSGINQDTTQSEQAAFEAAGTAGSSENTGSGDQ